MIVTDKYGVTNVMGEEVQVKRSMRPEDRVANLRLHGPAAHFALGVLRQCPQLSDHQIERAVKGWMKGLFMAQGNRVR